ncbi:MAG: tRNA pseudouridine(38-40) synthase TruA [Chloroflexi bacterium]|nr:tRNA pseudouridine(38-40) synthase TruA [Chloroflexota bacterium]MQC26498.1 tRNA pseudouridine(38-40) synthase TruA [Chloroflexota bacterium]
MARYKVVLIYDGTDFSGMQRQSNARSVQGDFEKALARLGWQDTSILFAGRTDAGVHASGQVVAFDLMNWTHSTSDLQNALNANLPQDMGVLGIQEVQDEFHPRYDATERTYQYRIICHPHRDPLRERYAWRVWPEIELSRFQKAADLLVGEHDFSAFGTPPKENGPTIRKVFAAEVQKIGKEEFLFEIKANAFLYHMVRRIVGLLVKIGQGSSEPELVLQKFEGVAELIQELAPANGLCLVNVDYN